ncbi:MAG: hypothetical protein Q8Q63_02425 [Phaeovulum sp.]|uniref:hypothetical protein n=2 Tax=Phaeovulum sp. TaxID=2934796 RepID=UPI002732D180|nr:hypothetical protein [Phaeovulum sp.]MDP3860421.1 hypothetical protein [Phaeovulum sp.]
MMFPFAAALPPMLAEKSRIEQKISGISPEVAGAVGILARLAAARESCCDRRNHLEFCPQRAHISGAMLSDRHCSFIGQSFDSALTEPGRRNLAGGILKEISRWPLAP